MVLCAGAYKVLAHQQRKFNSSMHISKAGGCRDAIWPVHADRHAAAGWQHVSAGASCEHLIRFLECLPHAACLHERRKHAELKSMTYNLPCITILCVAK